MNLSKIYEGDTRVIFEQWPKLCYLKLNVEAEFQILNFIYCTVQFRWKKDRPYVHPAFEVYYKLEFSA